MRPALKPGLRLVWRDRDTLQIGIDSRRAIALTGMRGAAAVIGLLDGSRDRVQVIAAATDRGIQAETADRIITLLAAAGTLYDFPASTIATLPGDARARVASELATASLAHGDGDGGARVLVRRQAAVIRVHGTGPVGSCIASLLTAAGIGRVVSAGPVAECPPRCPQSARAPEPGAWPPPAAGPHGTPPMAPRPGGNRPDLAVLIGQPDPELASALVRERYPAPRGFSQRGDRRRGATGRSRAVSLLALSRLGQDRPRPGMAAHSRPAVRPRAAARGLRRSPGRGGRSAGRPSGTRFHRPGQTRQRGLQWHPGTCAA